MENLQPKRGKRHVSTTQKQNLYTAIFNLETLLMVRRLTDRELEEIKTYDLVTYAEQEHGYRVIGRRSEASTTMTGTYGKIVLKKNDNGHWVFFPVNENAQGGSIVDFYMYHMGEISTGKAIGGLSRQLLLGADKTLPKTNKARQGASPDEIKPCRDQAALDVVFNTTMAINQNHWLMTKRAISKEMFAGVRFTEAIRRHPDDKHGNVLFPHKDKENKFCGFEARNKGFYGFFDGIPDTKNRLVCEKGLWNSNAFSHDDTLIIGESAIDMLSFEQLFSPKNARYVSTGGAWGKKTTPAITKAVENFPGKYVVLAFDKDKAGKFYTAQATDLLNEQIKQSGKCIRTLAPVRHTDWNEQLQAGSKERFSCSSC